MESLGTDFIIIGDDWQGRMPEKITNRYEVIYLPRTPEISTTEIKRRIYDQKT